MQQAPASAEFIIDAGRDHDAREQLEHALGSAFVPMAVQLGSGMASPAAGESPFRARMYGHRVHDLGILDASCGPCGGTRGPSRIRRSDSDYIAVLILRAGRERVSQDGEQAMLCSGDVLICDTQRAMDFDLLDLTHKQILLTPRSAIEEITGAAWPATAMMLSSTSPATTLLVNHLDVLIRNLPSLSPSAAFAARTATLYLLAGAASPAGTQLTADTAPELLVEAMKQWIDDHLLDPDLRPETVALAHAVSLRSAQRLFQRVGESLASHIRQRRLSRARYALLSATPINDIAHHYGFYDAGHFTRAFKTEFGTTPSDYRKSWSHPSSLDDVGTD